MRSVRRADGECLVAPPASWPPPASPPPPRGGAAVAVGAERHRIRRQSASTATASSSPRASWAAYGHRPPRHGGAAVVEEAGRCVDGQPQRPRSPRLRRRRRGRRREAERCLLVTLPSSRRCTSPSSTNRVPPRPPRALRLRRGRRARRWLSAERRLLEALAASDLRGIVVNGCVVIVVTATNAASWKRWRRRAGGASRPSYALLRRHRHLVEPLPSSAPHHRPRRLRCAQRPGAPPPRGSAAFVGSLRTSSCPRPQRRPRARRARRFRRGVRRCGASAGSWKRWQRRLRQPRRQRSRRLAGSAPPAASWRRWRRRAARHRGHGRPRGRRAPRLCRPPRPQRARGPRRQRVGPLRAAAGRRPAGRRALNTTPRPPPLPPTAPDATVPPVAAGQTGTPVGIEVASDDLLRPSRGQGCRRSNKARACSRAERQTTEAWTVRPGKRRRGS